MKPLILLLVLFSISGLLSHAGSILEFLVILIAFQSTFQESNKHIFHEWNEDQLLNKTMAFKNQKIIHDVFYKQKAIVTCKIQESDLILIKNQMKDNEFHPELDEKKCAEFSKRLGEYIIVAGIQGATDSKPKSTFNFKSWLKCFVKKISNYAIDIVFFILIISDPIFLFVHNVFIVVKNQITKKHEINRKDKQYLITNINLLINILVIVLIQVAIDNRSNFSCNINTFLDKYSNIHQFIQVPTIQLAIMILLDMLIEVYRIFKKDHHIKVIYYVLLYYLIFATILYIRIDQASLLDNIADNEYVKDFIHVLDKHIFTPIVALPNLLDIKYLQGLIYNIIFPGGIKVANMECTVS